MAVVASRDLNPTQPNPIQSMTIVANIRVRSLRNLLVFLALAALSADAGARDLSIRCLTVKNGYPKTGVFLHHGSSRAGEPLDVKGFLNHKRQEIKIKENELVFTSDSAAASVEDESLVVGRVTLPAGVESCLFVFEPPVGERPARVLFAEDSLEAFPAGSFKILNLSGVELRLELEGNKYALPRDELILIDEVPVGKRNAAAMAAFRKQGDEWRSVASGSWSHPGKKRVFYVATSDKSGRYIKMTGFRDISMPR